jgi:hypothetical protein
MAKRKIFAELMEGIAAMKAQRKGEMALDSHSRLGLSPRINA